MSDRLRVISAEWRRFIPRELIDGPAWEHLVRRVGGLPGWPVLDRVFLEFMPGTPAPVADFSVRVFPRRPHLMGYFIKRGEVAPSESRAGALGRFLRRVAHPETESESGIDNWFNDVMLEYDVADAPQRFPDPGLFLGLRPASAPEDPAVWIPGDVTAELAKAVGWNENVGERRVVDRIADALPATGRLDHLGAMPGRTTRTIRVIVNGVDAKRMPVFLEQAGWPGSVRRVRTLLRDWIEALPFFRPCLDACAHGLRTRLGLEMFPRAERHARHTAGDWLTTGENSWLPILKRLEQRQLCLPEKGRALRALQGYDRVVHRDGIYILHKGLNHVKLTIDEDAVQAKVYAGLRLLRINT